MVLQHVELRDNRGFGERVPVALHEPFDVVLCKSKKNDCVFISSL